jgi:hypothetical protein
MLDAAGYPLKDGKRFSLEFTYMAFSPFYAIVKSVAAPGRLVGTAEIPQLPAGIAAAQKGVSYVPKNETAHAVACGSGAISDEARGGTVNGM